METEKKYTPAECLKIISAYFQKTTADYIKNGEPFLAAAMFGNAVANFTEVGIKLELWGERNGKKCGKVTAAVIRNYTAHGSFNRKVDWDNVRGMIRVFNYDNHRERKTNV